MGETQLPWNAGTHDGLVSIGSHKLHLYASGPTRQTLNGTYQPAVIIEAGLGSSQSEWVAVQRLIAAKARVYTYDRAGYGRSQASPLPPTAQNRVLELTHLLDAAAIEPPYILVGHSYGGVLIREFLRRHPEKVAGMVIVDSSRVRTRLPTSWPNLMGPSSYPAIVGLDRNHILSSEEYETVERDQSRNMATAQVEEGFIASSTEAVNTAIPLGYQALGQKPLSVIFANESVDFGKIYDFSVTHGYGSITEQEEMRERLTDMEQVDEQGQRAHLGMSSRSRFVYAQDKGRTHNVQIVAPEMIRDEVFWALGITEESE
ncbi:hypothetical protein N7454_001689 [Penicillium verhagenii]|nr:hypothetical protein N7454_001689 [Penicillium verhagenii]